MFRAMFSPIIRSTWPYLHYLVVFTQIAAGWCLGWVETAETWSLRAVDQKCLESFEMWCWRRMEKISWTFLWEIKYCLQSKSKGIFYMKYVNGRRTGLVTFCVETAFYNGLLKERYNGGQKWQEGKEEGVGSYWMTLRKGEDNLIWKRKLWIALCGELTLEEALELS
jgi:hypothetical protein